MPGVRTGRNLSITIDTRNDLLFTMSDNTHFSPASRDKPTSPSCDETRICFLRTNLIPTGGARRDRTDDLLLAKQALSQLSYGPRSRPAQNPVTKDVVGLGRFELPTSRLSSARSNQLSYKPKFFGGPRGPHRAIALSESPRLVREERETKTAKSRIVGLFD